MSGRGIKLSNDYAQEVPSYEGTPKAVLAAIAFSFALRLSEDDPIRARGLIRQEWATLHANGILPQRPRK